MKYQNTTIGSFVSARQAHIQTGPFGTQLKASDYVENGTPVINVRNIGYGSLIQDKLEFVNEDTKHRLSVHLLQKGDIVFGRKGAVDRHLYVTEEQINWMQGSDCIRLRFSSEKINTRYVSCAFLSEAHRKWMLTQSGNKATMASLNQDIIKRINIYLPSLMIQNKIAEAISCYDNLIDTNRRRIQLLEEAARLLFREWFVYFRFPRLRQGFGGQAGHEKAKMVDGAPEGWKKEKINKLVSFKRGVEPGSANYLETYESGSFPFFRVSDLVTRNPSIFVDEQYAKSALLKTSDIVISLDGSVGIVSMGLEGCYSTGIRKLIIKDKKINRAYLYFLFKSHYVQGVINAYAKGTTIQHAGEAIKHINPILPPQNLMDLFDEIANPALNEILILLEENQKLAQARDLLLPRLMSGAIEV